MIIAPSGGGQAFQFQMCVMGQVMGPVAAPDMTRVEKQRHGGVMFAHRAAHPFKEILDRLFGELVQIGRVGPIQPQRLHLGLRAGADRRKLETDVHENPVRVGVTTHHFVDLGAEIVEVRR